jgi:hypothetical protein
VDYALVSRIRWLQECTAIMVAILYNSPYITTELSPCPQCGYPEALWHVIGREAVFGKCPYCLGINWEEIDMLE